MFALVFPAPLCPLSRGSNGCFLLFLTCSSFSALPSGVRVLLSEAFVLPPPACVFVHVLVRVKYAALRLQDGCWCYVAREISRANPGRPAKAACQRDVHGDSYLPNQLLVAFGEWR